MKPFSPHQPSQQQKSFLALDGEEGLYGGAAGGGKSDALILDALQYVNVPGYSAGLFRRTKEDLNKPGSILDRARTWFAGSAARWDDKLHGFRFPTRSGAADATIHFGYAQSLDEVKTRYSGPEFQYIGVDELFQWQQSVYLFLFSRLRRLVGFPVPVRMRSASNPGSEWVKDRFVAHAKHIVTGLDAREAVRRRRRGEAMPVPPYFESPPSSEALALAKELGRNAQGAFFVPAFAQDNPGLDLADYRSKLIKLDPTTRAQLEWGDWDAIASGDFFKPEWFQYLEPDDYAVRTLKQSRAWDLAASEVKKKNKDPDWSAGVKGGVDKLPTGAERLILTHAERRRGSPGDVERFVRALAEVDGKSVRIYLEEEPGSAGLNNTHNYAAKVLFGWQVEGVRKTGPKPEYWKPVSSAAQNGLLWLVRAPWNAEFVAELCALTPDDSHEHDDYADATGLLFSKLLARGNYSSEPWTAPRPRY